jgi:hypothetical protein
MEPREPGTYAAVQPERRDTMMVPGVVWRAMLGEGAGVDWAPWIDRMERDGIDRLSIYPTPPAGA